MVKAKVPGTLDTWFPAEIVKEQAVKGIPVSIIRIDNLPDSTTSEFYLARPLRAEDDRDAMILVNTKDTCLKFYNICCSDGYVSMSYLECAIEELEGLEKGTYDWQVKLLLGEN